MQFNTLEEANIAIQYLIQQRDNINNEYVKSLVKNTLLQNKITELSILNNKNADAPKPAREV